MEIRWQNSSEGDFRDSNCTLQLIIQNRKSSSKAISFLLIFQICWRYRGAFLQLLWRSPPKLQLNVRMRFALCCYPLTSHFTPVSMGSPYQWLELSVLVEEN